MVSSSSRVFVCASALLVLVVALASTSEVSGRSHGLLGYCDLTPVAASGTGANANGWPNGKFGKYLPSGPASGVMNWVMAPNVSDAYTIRTADDSTKWDDPSTYEPGRPVEIHLRVVSLKMRFIGLVLYATNGTNPSTGKELMVGSWQIPQSEEFQAPPLGEGCFGAVTHTNANVKPFHTRFYWTAPVGVNTGTVRFRVLIKQGEQNKGNFYWPSKELKLKQAAPVARTKLSVIGVAGRACADVCYWQTPDTPYCDASAIQAINTPTALASALDHLVPVRLPYLAQCAYAGVPNVNGEGFASFTSSNVASTCPASWSAAAAASTATMPDVCYTAPLATSRAICICNEDPTVQTKNPFKVEDVKRESRMTQFNVVDGDEEMSEEDVLSYITSSGSKTSSSVSTLLLMMLSFIVVGSTSSSSSSSFRSLLFLTLSVCLLLLSSSPVSGHNYIKSQHRAYEAAVANPCQSRMGNQPHVQVIDGQTFEIEWSVGHGDYTNGPFYFTIIKDDYYQNLRADNITAILKDYIASAPTSAYNTDPMFEKHHIRKISECDSSGTNSKKLCNPTAYFKEESLPSTDPTFITRDTVYISKSHPNQYTKPSEIIQTRFLDSWVAQDKRVSYISEKYPWIEAVHAFTNPFKEHDTYNNQASIARFTIPARKGSGDYIVWFKWSGYTDCVDVNVMSGKVPVVNRYGLAASTTSSEVVKMDHCEYTYIGWIASSCRKIDPITRDASQCIQECQTRGASNCNAVQVVRYTVPSQAFQTVPNIPFTPYTYNATLIDAGGPNPCGQLSVADRVAQGCPETPVEKRTYWCDPRSGVPGGLSMKADDYMCFGLRPMRNQDNQVEEDYQIATETVDPAFYSTCYSIIPPGGFLNTPPIVYTPPSWNVGDGCIDCAFHSSMTNLNTTQSPLWTSGLTPSSGVCQDCSIKNSKASITQLPLAGANQPNAGAPQAVEDGGSSSSSDSTLIIAIVIVVVSLVVIGGASGALYYYRHRRAKDASTTLGRIETSNNASEMTSNPAIANTARWNKI